MNVMLSTIGFLATNVYTDVVNNFVIEYFRYKKLSSVIGYSCNDIENDILLMKDFSDIGVTAILKKVNDETQLYPIALTEYQKIGIFLDTRCLDLGEIVPMFLDAANHRMYDELHSWLILGYNVTDIAYVIDDRAFGVSTDFVIAVTENDDYFELYDVYNFAKDRGGPLNITYLGDWMSDGNLTIDLTQSKFSRRSNLHGVTLQATFYKTIYRPSEMSLEEYFDDYAHAQREGLSKFGFNLVKHLSDLFNFSLKCHQSEEWAAGDKLGPIVRALGSDEVDMSGTPISMNTARTYLVKYVHQDWPFRTCFIFRNPQPKNVKIKEMFRPFADDVWFLILILMSAAIVVLAFITRYEWSDCEMVRLSNSFILVIGVLCQQGTTIQINNISTRIAFVSILIFAFLIYTYYSAGVVSARLNEPIRKINDSLSELAKLPLRFSSEPMVYFDFFMKRPDWETAIFYMNKWLPLSAEQRFMDPETAMRFVKDGGFAYHTHPDVAYPIVDRFYNNREICELTEVHLARPTRSTFAVALNSTIVEIIRVGLTKISEVGLRTRQVSRWQYRKPRCRKDVLSASSVNVYEFSPHLLLLLIGYLIALSMCIVEIYIANRNAGEEHFTEGSTLDLCIEV